MSEITCAYRAEGPEVVSAVRAYDETLKAAREAAAAFAAEVGEGYSAMNITSNFEAFKCVGLQCPDDIDPQQVPVGWRVGTVELRHGYMHVLVPDKRRKAGKEAAAALGGVPVVKPLSGALPGMPGMVMDGAAWRRPGILEHEGAVYAYWTCDPEVAIEREGCWSPVKEIDASLWTRIKLSAFYLVKEQMEEQGPKVSAA